MRKPLCVLYEKVEKNERNIAINLLVMDGRFRVWMDSCTYIPSEDWMNACMDDRMKEQWMSHNGMEEAILGMIHDALSRSVCSNFCSSVVFCVCSDSL